MYDQPVEVPAAVMEQHTGAKYGTLDPRHVDHQVALQNRDFLSKHDSSISRAKAGWRPAEEEPESMANAPFPPDESLESIPLRSVPQTSLPTIPRTPSSVGSEEDENTEDLPLGQGHVGANSSPSHRKHRARQPLSGEVKLWILMQLGIPYIIAIAAMGLHLGFFLYLDGKPVNETISQSLQSATANLLAFIVGTALISVIAVAYDQTLWRLFSSKFLKVRVIHTLVTLTSNPWKIVRFELLREAPWQWTLVWSCILLPIACNFPPGAVSVVDGMHMMYDKVPTLNVSMLGNGSITSLVEHMLFDTMIGLYYLGPRERLKSITNAVLTTGEAYALPGPCSSHCKYALEFKGPFWDCNDVAAMPWPEMDGHHRALATAWPTVFWASLDQHDGSDGRLNAGDILAQTLVVQWWSRLNYSDPLDWDMSINATDSRGNIMPSNQINCTTKIVDYKTSISYDKIGHRQISWDAGDTFAAPDAMPVRRDYQDIFARYSSRNPSPNSTVNLSAELLRDFTKTQIHAIHEAALRSVLGYVIAVRDNYSESFDNFFTMANRTRIGESRLIHAAPADPIITVDITPAILQDTIEYSFGSKVQFFAPYAFSLLATTVIALVGINCLVLNGASATSSFLQYISTTRVSSSSQQYGLAGSRGGEENFTETLKSRRLLFGIQKLKSTSDEDSESSHVPAYGFGEAHEIERF